MHENLISDKSFYPLRYVFVSGGEGRKRIYYWTYRKTIPLPNSTKYQANKRNCSSDIKRETKLMRLGDARMKSDSCFLF